MADQVYSGNQASDYQPPTRNPQDNAATNLQPNQTVLQPVTGTQVNQQALPIVASLQVVNNGTKQEASVSPAKSHSPPITQIGFLTLLIVLVAAVVYMSKFKNRVKSPTAAEAEILLVDSEIDKPHPNKKKHHPRPGKKRRNRSAKKYR